MADARDVIEPHDDATAQAQLAFLLQACQGRRVLDMGCGQGRLTAPLSAAGMDVVAVDFDRSMLDACSAAAPAATCVHGDMCDVDLPAQSFDVVLCLGNTIMVLHDVERAVAAMRHWARLLRPGGVIYVDDIAADLWPEVAGGCWIDGVAEDGRQLVWAHDDAVFALRDAAGSEHLQPGDRHLRLWTKGALRLLAMASGLDGPVPQSGGAVVMFSDPKNVD